MKRALFAKFSRGLVPAGCLFLVVVYACTTLFCVVSSFFLVRCRHHSSSTQVWVVKNDRKGWGDGARMTVGRRHEESKAFVVVCTCTRERSEELLRTRSGTQWLHGRVRESANGKGWSQVVKLMLEERNEVRSAKVVRWSWFHAIVRVLVRWVANEVCLERDAVSCVPWTS